MSKKTEQTSGFGMSLLWNFLLNLSWSIPAWILLIFHFYKGWPILWFWIALISWLIIIFIASLSLKFVHKCSNAAEKPFRENKNPYSSDAYHPTKNAKPSEKKNNYKN